MAFREAVISRIGNNLRNRRNEVLSESSRSFVAIERGRRVEVVYDSVDRVVRVRLYRRDDVSPAHVEELSVSQCRAADSESRVLALIDRALNLGSVRGWGRLAHSVWKLRRDAERDSRCRRRQRPKRLRESLDEDLRLIEGATREELEPLLGRLQKQWCFGHITIEPMPEFTAVVFYTETTSTWDEISHIAGLLRSDEELVTRVLGAPKPAPAPSAAPARRSRTHEIPLDEIWGDFFSPQHTSSQFAPGCRWVRPKPTCP